MTTTQDSEWLEEIIQCVYNNGKMSEWKLSETNSSDILPWLMNEQAKAKIRQHMLSEALELIGEDDKEFTKRSRPYDDTDTNKLWDLANGVEPISSSQFSTWGSSANVQFRKFALKLRNTIWKEAELHNNDLRAELRQAFTEKYGERE